MYDILMRFESLKFPKKLFRQVKLLRLLYHDPRTPKSFKLLSWVLLVYLLSPIDLIPDFIPVLGQLDDFLIGVIGYKLLLRMCPPELVEERRRQIGNS
jgi:uncharacterized membrane protein YkvA (DUF1232 family)